MSKVVVVSDGSSQQSSNFVDSAWVSNDIATPYPYPSLFTGTSMGGTGIGGMSGTEGTTT
jgi:hypothetical protein